MKSWMENFFFSLFMKKKKQVHFIKYYVVGVIVYIFQFSYIFFEKFHVINFISRYVLYFKAFGKRDSFDVWLEISYKIPCKAMWTKQMVLFKLDASKIWGINNRMGCITDQIIRKLNLHLQINSHGKTIKLYTLQCYSILC